MASARGIARQMAQAERQKTDEQIGIIEDALKRLKKLNYGKQIDKRHILIKRIERSIADFRGQPYV